MKLCTGRKVHSGSRGIALLFHDHGTRMGWGVNVTPRPLFTLRKDAVLIVQVAGWTPGPVWIEAENLCRHRDSIPGPSSPLLVGIPTELPGPPVQQACRVKVLWLFRRRELNSVLDGHTHTWYTCNVYCLIRLFWARMRPKTKSDHCEGVGGVGVNLRKLLMCFVDCLHSIMTGMQAISLMKLGSTSDTRRSICALQCDGNRR